MGFLKGTINITDNINFITDLMMNPIEGTIVINLDEDTKLKGNNVIGGAELLAPPDAMMAEIDGDEQTYDSIYFNYFNQPFIKQYMMGIVHFLYNKGNIIMYYETLDMSGSKTISKLLNMIWVQYGIGIGIIGRAPGNYNENFIPLWLTLLYQAGTIGIDQFLVQFPSGVQIDNSTMGLLIQELNPYTNKPQEFVYNLIKERKKNPNIRVGLINN